MKTAAELLEAQLLGDEDWIAASDLCRLCHLELDAMIELVELGVVSPRGYKPEEWQLPATVLPRLRTAARLMHDLGVNTSGVALALELLEAQREMEARLRLLERLR